MSYERHLAATAAWLLRSIDHGKGGSCAYFSPAGGWSRPYPETSGYLIPTLLSLSRALPGFDGEARAVGLGEWLLSIQDPAGYWHGGVHPPKSDAAPSVFNSAQILQGMVALHDRTGEGRWLEAALRAARWLASGTDSSGLWPQQDYRAEGTPSYYSYAAWPMLEVAARADDTALRSAGTGALDAILARRRPNGTFAEWSFAPGQAAFTHTIAYTLQGFVSSALLLDEWDRFGAPAEQALGELARLGEAAAGRLAGQIDDDWRPAGRYVCLTGNAQIALCILDRSEGRGDDSLDAAATGLVDAVCAAQRLRAPLPSLRGAVAGSSPLWGRYMILRYPNWAAKYHCDALMRLIARGGPG